MRRRDKDRDEKVTTERKKKSRHRRRYSAVIDSNTLKKEILTRRCSEISVRCLDTK